LEKAFAAWVVRCGQRGSQHAHLQHQNESENDFHKQRQQHGLQ
jgi:hypothetical protein